ncbi:MAG: general L-amino acid transport system substrate-binding protein, partial [Cocleimonas sp.]
MRKSVLLSLAAVAMFSTTVQADTLDDVKKAGMIKCGVSTGLAGFSQKDEAGNWSGLDVDVC